MFPAISAGLVLAARIKCRAVNSVSAPLFAARHLSMSGQRLKTFEPDYLDSSSGIIPTYPTLNIQLKSYNFDLLESLQRYVHKLAENMGIDVVETWATPPQSYKISNYLEESTRVKSEFSLNMYERNVQMINLRSTDAAILFDTIKASLPQSVHLSVHEHTTEAYEARFIPDAFIDSIRQELAQGQEKLEEEKDKRSEKAAAKLARKQAALLQSMQEGEDD